MLNEEFLNESMNSGDIVTGADIANMLGMSDLYQQGKEMEAQGLEMEESVKNKFTNLMERINKVPRNIDKDFD